MIENIRIEKIEPHWDNPRKDLGDLSELAESIKERGILQNLTVVPMEAGYCRSCELYLPGSARQCRDGHAGGVRPPCEHWQQAGKYTVIIGHRRLAAAKLAGLTEVPCVIADMDRKTQVATMLMENIQRSDLTPIEQAKGFQMMIDLGESITNISEQTGFSDSTIRRRLSLVSLDQEELEKAQKRGGTLMDYAELEKVKDIDLKNKVLAAIGTANFKSELMNALQLQKLKVKMVEWLEVIKTFAEEDPQATYPTRQYVRNYGYYRVNEDVIIPADADTVKYYYKIGDQEIAIYKEHVSREESEEEIKRKEMQGKEEAKRKRLQSITETHYKLRLEFVKGLSNATCKKNLGKIAEFMTYNMCFDSDMYSRKYIDPEIMADCLGVEINTDELEDNHFAELPGINPIINKSPEKTAFCITYCCEDNDDEGYFARSWDPGVFVYKYIHEPNNHLDAIYEILTILGYEMSDEERAMQDGTHELFEGAEENE